MMLHVSRPLFLLLERYSTGSDRDSMRRLKSPSSSRTPGVWALSQCVLSSQIYQLKGPNNQCSQLAKDAALQPLRSVHCTVCTLSCLRNIQVSVLVKLNPQHLWHNAATKMNFHFFLKTQIWLTERNLQCK